MNNGFRPLLRKAHQPVPIIVTDGNRRHTYGGAVSREDLCKGLPYDGPDPPTQKGLGGVFPGGAASEVPSHDQNTRVLESAVAEGVIFGCSVLVKTLIVEDGLSQPVKGDGFKISCRYDAFGVDIRSGERKGPATMRYVES